MGNIFEITFFEVSIFLTHLKEGFTMCFEEYLTSAC